MRARRAPQGESAGPVMNSMESSASATSGAMRAVGTLSWWERPLLSTQMGSAPSSSVSTMYSYRPSPALLLPTPQGWLWCSVNVHEKCTDLSIGSPDRAPQELTSAADGIHRQVKHSAQVCLHAHVLGSSGSP